jgi:hypothetical protein
MKNRFILFITLIVIAFSSMNMNCHTEDCDIPVTTNYSASVNVYDDVIGIYTQTFMFTQTQKTYSSTDCGPASSSTDLKIKNLTPYIATYSYTITYNLNLVTWVKQGSVVIAPLSTVDIGDINESLTRIDLGQIQVVYYGVSYR